MKNGKCQHNYHIYCHHSGWLHSSARMRNGTKKKSHNSQRLPLFSILYDYFLKFSENRNKQFKLRPMHFKFSGTGNYITSFI